MQFDPRNILVIDFGQLGDVVMSLPALRAIRERFPRARITVAAGKPAAEIVKLSGYSSETFEIDRVALRDGPKLLSIARIFRIVSQVRKAKFDFVIDLHSLSETNLLGFLSGAPQRLYARRPNRSLDYLSNFKPRPPAEAKESHLVDRYLDVLKPLGISIVHRTPQLKTSAAANASVEALLKREKVDTGALLVGLFPGAGYKGRRWPLERFAELADYLIRNDRVRVIVFAGPEEPGFIDQMRKTFPASTLVFDRLTIPQLVSLQARLTLFISNDTGPCHTAAAVGTSVMVLMGEPNLHSYVPVGDHTFVCAESIRDITVERVYGLAHELLAANRTEKLFSQ
ncbi:MAG TPA: glycosyltransferase family 9 protein [Pyrinomonadaceae bacterium]|nr:glycosyltransferase family 9 protein [Pyrinomonadaceae bacterium]